MTAKPPVKPLPLDDRKKALALFDSGVPAGKVAEKFGVSVNTVYSWKQKSKKDYASTLSAVEKVTARRGRPPAAPMEAVTTAANDLVTELARLRKENDALKKLVDLYRNIAGM